MLRYVAHTAVVRQLLGWQNRKHLVSLVASDCLEQRLALLLLLHPVFDQHIHAFLELEIQVPLVVQWHLRLVILKRLLRAYTFLLFIERHELVPNDLAQLRKRLLFLGSNSRFFAVEQDRWAPVHVSL